LFIKIQYESEGNEKKTSEKKKKFSTLRNINSSKERELRKISLKLLAQRPNVVKNASTFRFALSQKHFDSRYRSQMHVRINKTFRM
jgi:hypothetical protein